MRTQETDHPRSRAVTSSALTAANGRIVSAWNLLVADQGSPDTCHLVQALERHGNTVRQVDSGAAAIDHHTSHELVILDLDLPDLDGLEVCRAIRAASDIPIIVVTSRNSELDRILGLQAGADDYMQKPCPLYELIARIEAVMRRANGNPTNTGVTEHGPLKININSRTVHLNGSPVLLTRKEFDLLRILTETPGKVHSRKVLMNHIWGDSWSRRTIDTHVSSIRRKLGESNWITTVRGVGFQFCPPDQNG